MFEVSFRLENFSWSLCPPEPTNSSQNLWMQLTLDFYITILYFWNFRMWTKLPSICSIYLKKWACSTDVMIKCFHIIKASESWFQNTFYINSEKKSTENLWDGGCRMRCSRGILKKRTSGPEFWIFKRNLKIDEASKMAKPRLIQKLFQNLANWETILISGSK